MLTQRPVEPGSRRCKALVERVQSPAERHGRLLYPDHWRRRDDEQHRRACAAIAAAASKVQNKQNAPSPARPEAFTDLTLKRTGRDGCSAECA